MLRKDLRTLGKYKAKGWTDKVKEMKSKLQGKYGSLRACARRMKWTWGELQSLCRTRKKYKKARYSRKLSEATKADLLAFYKENSFSLPEARHAKKTFMRCNIQEACTKFNEGRTQEQRKVALSTFVKYRPKEVKLQKDIPLQSCLCQECANIKMLSKALISAGIQGICSSTHIAVESTICPHTFVASEGKDQGFKATASHGYRKCLYRECSLCGVHLMKSRIEEMNSEALADDPNVHYHVWESITKFFKGREVSRIEKIQKTVKLSEAVHTYLTSLGSIAKHLFLSKWQYQQFVRISKEVREGHLVLNSDYAMNISCENQSEVSASFYDRTLVTLAPTVCFYRCNNMGCCEVIRHEVVHLSADTKHDFGSYRKMHNDTLKLIEDETGKQFDLLISLTDGAPTVYKNRNNYLWMSESERKQIHVYTASAHGKCFSDTSSGRFKMFLRRAVLSGDVEIRNARDIYDYAKQKYETRKAPAGTCQHFRISINLVQNISRNSGKRSKTAEGTRGVHEVRNMGCPGLVKTRPIACLCPGCLDGDESKCENKEFCTEWNVQQVSQEKPKKTTDTYWPERINCQSDSEIELSEIIGVRTEELESMDAKIEKQEEVECTEVKDHGEEFCDSQVKSEVTRDRKKEESQATEQRGISVNSVQQGSRNKEDWKHIYGEMKDLGSYEELKRYCGTLKLSMVPSVFHGSFGPDDIADDIATELIPESCNILDGRKACSIVPDGNCFCRSLAKVVRDDEEMYWEFRCRLVHEGVLREEKYLNNTNLEIGANASGGAPVNICEHYTTYSSEYDPSKKLNEAEIRRVYQQEWYNFRLDTCYAGAYQFHAAASVLGATIYSHYSNQVIPFIHNDLNRKMSPLQLGADEEAAHSIHILWTKSSKDVGRLNHFVPLLQTSR